MKQTFNIPDGYKTVSVEQVGNQIITSFEPEKYVPKAGDCVKMQYEDSDFPAFCLIDKVSDGEILAKNVFIGETEGKKDIKFEDSYFLFYSSIEKLTPEEFQAEFEKLGYVYDFETHTARKKRKRVAVGKRYFYADELFKSQSYIEKRDEIDRNHFESGNYFETEEDCQTYCDYMRECSLKYFDK